MGSRIKSLQSALNELLHCQATIEALNKTVEETTTHRPDTKQKEDSQEVVSVTSAKTFQSKVSDKHSAIDESAAASRTKGKSNSAIDGAKPNAGKDTGCAVQDSNNKGKGDDKVQSQRTAEETTHTSKETASSSIGETTLDDRPKDQGQTSGVKVDQDPVTGPDGDQRKESTHAESSSSTCKHSTQPKSSNTSDNISSKELDERTRLQGILRSRLQFVLLNLIKLHSGTKKG